MINKRLVLLVLLSILIIGGLFLVNTFLKGDGALDNTKNSIESGLCSEDGDCVAESVCHPTSCVLKGQKNSNEMILCTKECRSETLDCGFGSCSCVNQKCEAIING